MRNQFINPRNNDTYDWLINHHEEDTFGKRRNIEHGANSANTGLIKQQGDDEPMHLSLKGTILHKSQYDEMWEWFALCASQTIYYRDFTGDKYEVIITVFNPTKYPTSRNPRDAANAEMWYWKYELEMEVVTFVDSSLEGVVTP